MREPSEMITVSRMQNMVEIRKKNTYFVTKSLFKFFEEKEIFENLGLKLRQYIFIHIYIYISNSQNIIYYKIIYYILYIHSKIEHELYIKTP